jgi:hypothetical protein
MLYRTLHRKLKIEQHKPQLKAGMNSGSPKDLAVSAPHVAVKTSSRHYYYFQNTSFKFFILNV